MPVQDTNNLPQNDARHHALNIAQSLRQLSAHSNQDIHKVDGQEGRDFMRRTSEQIDQLANSLEEYGYQNR